MQQWEYGISLLTFAGEPNDIDDAQKELDMWGEQGFELVSIIPKMGKNDSYAFAIMKRPKTEERKF